MIRRRFIGLCLSGILFCVCLLAGILLSDCGNGSPQSEEELRPLQLVLATDLHYLSPQLTDRGYYFQAISEVGDGRQLWYQQEILEAFAADMKERKPDAVLLAGDLTYNGEKLSHEDLAELLSELTEAGIPVYVIPGNHDINNLFSRSFFGEEAETAETVQIEDFQDIYKKFGYGRNRRRTRNGVTDHSPDKLSYQIKLYDRVSVYMLNTNKFLDGYQIGSEVPEDTLTWLDKCLKQDQKAGRVPIVAGHHNLLVHSKRFITGYQLSNYEALEEILVKYQVPLYLSGHLHIQHEAKENVTAEDGCTAQLWDVAGSSLAVNPHQYGVVTVDVDGSISYEKQTVQVERYAREQGRTEEDLLHFTEYAENFYYQNQYRRVLESLEETPLHTKEAEPLAEFVARLNVAYFAGMTEEERQSFREDEGYMLWQEAEEKLGDGARWLEYMRSILE